MRMHKSNERHALNAGVQVRQLLTGLALASWAF
jgi:hypothetical protein